MNYLYMKNIFASQLVLFNKRPGNTLKWAELNNALTSYKSTNLQGPGLAETPKFPNIWVCFAISCHLEDFLVTDNPQI